MAPDAVAANQGRNPTRLNPFASVMRVANQMRLLHARL